MKIRHEEADPVIDPATKPRSVDLHIPLPNHNDAYVYFGKRPTKEDIDTLTRHLMLVKETLDPELLPLVPAMQQGVGAPVQTIARARRWHGPHLTPEQEAAAIEGITAADDSNQAGRSRFRHGFRPEINTRDCT